MDLADLPTLDAKIERLLAHHNALRRGLGLEALSPRHPRRPDAGRGGWRGPEGLRESSPRRSAL